jgi:hypothetical protein
MTAIAIAAPRGHAEPILRRLLRAVMAAPRPPRPLRLDTVSDDVLRDLGLLDGRSPCGRER